MKKIVLLIFAISVFALKANAQTDSLIITQIISPSDTCFMTERIYPSVEIKNVGVNIIDSIEISFSVDGAYPTSYIYLDSISPNDSITHTFTYYFIAPSNNFSICCFIQYANKRDSVCKRIIVKTPENDVGISSLIIPNQSVFLGVDIFPKMWIKNYGVLPQDTIPVEYSMGGVNYTQETYYGLINPGDSVLYTFNTPYTLINIGSVWTTFYGQTALANDFSTCNNSIALSFWSSLNDNQTTIFTLLQNYPNPAANYTNIPFFSQTNSNVEFIVRDIDGRLVYKSEETAIVGENNISLNTENFANGVYFYSLQVDKEIQTKTFVIKND